MKLYGAIDLHSNNNVTVVIAQQLSAYQDSLQGIVVESTYNWYWLVDGHRLFSN